MNDPSKVIERAEKTLAAYRSIPTEVLDDLLTTYVLAPKCSGDVIKNTMLLAKQDLALTLITLALRDDQTAILDLLRKTAKSVASHRV